MTDFLTLAGRIKRHASACPTPTILAAIREAAIELCERGRVWKEEEDYIVAPGSIRDFSVTPPTNAEIISVEQVKYNSLNVPPISKSWLDKNWVGWEKEESNVPRYYYLAPDDDGFTVSIVPKPSETLTGISCELILRPSYDAAGMGTGILSRYRAALVAGALKEILSIADKPWTNFDLAKKNNYLFENGVASAISDNLKSFTNQSLEVNPHGDFGYW